MTAEHIRAAMDAWRGPLGKFIEETLKVEAESARLAGSQLLPRDTYETHHREQLFGKANGLNEFLESIPTRLKNELKAQETKEKS